MANNGAPHALDPSPIAKKIWLSIHPRYCGSHVTVRPSDWPGNQCEISPFLISVFSWQLSKQGIHWPISHDRIAGSVVDPSSLRVFLKLSAEKLLVSNWSQAQLWVNFFTMVTCLFFEVNYKSINQSFAFALAKSIYYRIQGILNASIPAQLSTFTSTSFE